MRRDSSGELFIAAHRLKFLCTPHKKNRSHVHNSEAQYNISLSDWLVPQIMRFAGNYSGYHCTSSEYF
jgi:hypothetical protein